MKNLFTTIAYQDKLGTAQAEAATGDLSAHSLSSLSLRAPQTVFAELRRKANWTDALFFVYLASCLRQYFWGVEQLTLAWVLTFALTGICCALHIIYREESEHKSSIGFWLIVALPLLLIYLLRAPFPDQDFDVLNYHLVNAARGMRGWPFIDGDFFPTVAVVNPAPNIAGGIFRYVLGYRLGTLINLCALVWAAQVANRFLSPYIKNDWLRNACILFVVSTEYILRLLNDYRVDLLFVPLLLEASYTTIRFGKARRKGYALIHIALLLGVSATFKLSNLAFAIPIGLACAVQLFLHRKQFSLKAALVALVVFIAPIVPFSLFLYAQTGNPLFPFLNKIFKSPYLPVVNATDVMYGPRNFLELVVWPVWAFFTPDRISEMSGIGFPYTGRLSLGFVVCLLCLFYKSTTREIRATSLLTLLGLFAWSALSGNVRYALYLEVMCGIVMLSLFSTLYKTAKETGRQRTREMVLFVLLFGGLLVVQFAGSYFLGIFQDKTLFNKTIQPTVFEEPKSYLAETPQLLRDHNALKYLSPQEQEMFARVDVWINSYYTTNGVEVALRPEIPMLSVCDYMNTLDYLRKEEAKQLFAAKLARVEGKRMYSLSPVRKDFLDLSLYFITRAGLGIGEMTTVDVPFYSPNIRRRMVLIEVLPTGQGKDKNAVPALVEKYGEQE